MGMSIGIWYFGGHCGFNRILIGYDKYINQTKKRTNSNLINKARDLLCTENNDDVIMRRETNLEVSADLKFQFERFFWKNPKLLNWFWLSQTLELFLKEIKRIRKNIMHTWSDSVNYRPSCGEEGLNTVTKRSQAIGNLMRGESRSREKMMIARGGKWITPEKTNNKEKKLHQNKTKRKKLLWISRLECLVAKQITRLTADGSSGRREAEDYQLEAGEWTKIGWSEAEKKIDRRLISRKQT